MEIESELKNLRLVEDFLEETCRKLRIDRVTYGKVLVAVMEAANNAIIHGNKSTRDKKVTILISPSADSVEVSVRDEGDGFIPGLIPDPTFPENRENIRGRGVFLMKKLSDRIVFNDKGNSVTLTFARQLS